jgi:rubrerythrin
MNKDVAKALEIAEKQEQDGIDWYSKLAEQCGSEAAEQMFLSFKKDEERHLKWVRNLAEGVGVDLSQAPLPRESIKTVFDEAEDHTDEYATSTEDQHEAIDIALGMEKKSYDNYKQAAEDSEDSVAKAMFERLAQEENQHYEMLENTMEYLENSDRWFLSQEQSLIMGDQSSLPEA